MLTHLWARTTAFRCCPPGPPARALLCRPAPHPHPHHAFGGLSSPHPDTSLRTALALPQPTVLVASPGGAWSPVLLQGQRARRRV